MEKQREEVLWRVGTRARSEAITITNTLEFINNAKSRTMEARFVLEGGRVAYEMRGEGKERRFK